MEINTLALICAAHLFSGVLSELNPRDGWVSFEPGFADFVIAQKIEWWSLYENPELLRSAMVVALFTPEQLQSFAASPTKRTDIIRETFALAKETEDWEASFGADIAVALNQVPATPKHKKWATDRSELLCAALIANLYNYIAVMVFGKSLCDLLAKAKDGDDTALIHAVQIDRTVLNLPHLQQRLARAQLGGESDFLTGLGYRLGNPHLRSKLSHPSLWLAFAILQDEGMLAPDKRPTYAELMDLCRQASVYDGDDVDAFRKSLTHYLNEQDKRTRKDF